jgi:hypothetical protein
LRVLYVSHTLGGGTPKDRDTMLSPFVFWTLILPHDIDRSLNEAVSDEIRKYRADYSNNPPNVIFFMSAIVSTSGRLHSGFVRLYSYRLIGKLTVFLQFQEFSWCIMTVVSSTTAVFSSHFKSKVGNILTKVAELRTNLSIDGEPMVSRSHNHPSQSQTSRLLTSSLSLGVPVPRTL